MIRNTFSHLLSAAFVLTAMSCSRNVQFESAGTLTSSNANTSASQASGTAQQQIIPVSNSSNTGVVGAGPIVSASNTSVTTNGTSSGSSNTNVSTTSTTVSTSNGGTTVTTTSNNSNPSTNNGSSTASSTGSSTTASNGCQTDPNVSTSTMLASANRSFALAMSFCRDGIQKFGFFVGQRVFSERNFC